MLGIEFSQVMTWTVGKAADVISKYFYYIKALKKPPVSWSDLIKDIRNYM